MDKLEQKLESAIAIRQHKTNVLHMYCRIFDYYTIEQGMNKEDAMQSAKQKMFSLYGNKFTGMVEL